MGNPEVGNSDYNRPSWMTIANEMCYSTETLLLAEDNNLPLHSNQYSGNPFFQLNNAMKWV